MVLTCLYPLGTTLFLPSVTNLFSVGRLHLILTFSQWQGSTCTHLPNPLGINHFSVGRIHLVVTFKYLSTSLGTNLSMGWIHFVLTFQYPLDTNPLSFGKIHMVLTFQFPLHLVLTFSQWAGFTWYSPSNIHLLITISQWMGFPWYSPPSIHFTSSPIWQDLIWY